MTTQDMIDIIGQINYKPNWSILVHKDERHYVQIKVTGGTCSQTGKPADWVTGKRYLSEHMCSQELVGLVFALIKDAEEHEMREFFRYKGRAIFRGAAIHACPK